MLSQPKSKIATCQTCHEEREVFPTGNASWPEESFGKCPVCGSADYVVLTENERHERDIAKARADKAKAEARRAEHDAKKAEHDAKRAEEEARHERKKADQTDVETKNRKKDPYWQAGKTIALLISAAVAIVGTVMKAKDKK